MTVPARSSSGPPLLPGFTAASVCTSVALPLWRRALTMPRVTVFCSVPSADPIAKTSWPTRSPAAVPIGIVAWPGAALGTFSTAMS